MPEIKPPLNKQIILDFLKMNSGKRFTKNYLVKELKRECGNTYSVNFNAVDKWVEVLLAEKELQYQYAGRIKLFWCGK